jgi:hypothetical protein
MARSSRKIDGMFGSYFAAASTGGVVIAVDLAGTSEMAR